MASEAKRVVAAVDEQQGTHSERLADFAISLTLDDVPAELVWKAKAHLLDGLGIALASTQFEFAGSVLAGARALGGGGSAHALGSGEPLPPVNAALVNGTLVHGLDFDDTHVTAIYHATAPALPAVLAAGEASGASGRDVLTAFIVALEIGSRIGDAAEGGLHDRGFHPTALCGTFAAAYGAGRLLGADRAQLVSASNLCGSQAGGILEFGDGWLKRLHPGWAAHAGYAAAIMALNGFKGAGTVFEGKHGFYATHLGRVPEEHILPATDIGHVWKLAGIALKPYPCCHFIHAFVDAALALREQVDVSRIARIDCPLHRRLHPLVADHRELRIHPQNSYQAMFSVPYVVALALVKGQVDLAAFHDLGIDDPEVLRVAALAYCEDDPHSDFPRHFPGEIRITMQDGQVIQRREATSTGTPDRPLSHDTIEAKFMANAVRAVPAQRAADIARCVWGIETQSDLGALIGLCTDAC